MTQEALFDEQASFKLGNTPLGTPERMLSTPIPEATRVQFSVIGKAEPAGSKRAFALKRGGQYTGRVAVSDSNPKARGWKDSVAYAAAQAMGTRAPMLGALRVTVTIYQQRPKGHYGSGKNAHVLKASAPRFPAVKPDATKLWRGTEDAMTGIVWRDDAQIVDQHVVKRYADAAPFVAVLVEALE